MAANITEYLSKLQELAKQNIKLLNAINESFHTKQEYISIELGNNSFNVPSFLSLENRLNTLQANFENLVEAPKTGTAAFVFDGATKTIQCGGFNICPDAVKLDTPQYFNIEANDVLKDFMTPVPYVKFSIASIPNNITYCSVRKYVIFNNELRNLLFNTNKTSTSIEYAVVNSAVAGYTEDVDYQVYDTTVRLPLRENIGRGTFNIMSVDSSNITDNFTQYYTLHLDDITYTVDSVQKKRLKVGDILVTYNDECQLEITEINELTNTVTVEVLHNGYSNITTEEVGGDLGKLKFYSSLDYNQNKHVDVPLEENQYIIVFIAPIYDLLNTRAEWSNGVAINTFNLLVNIDGEDMYFKDYYDSYVTNIGDGIMNLVAQMGDMMSSYSKEQFDSYSNAKPVFENYVVTQINSHISNSETYKKIKSLYKSKQNFKNEINSVQNQIDDINNKLAEIDFDDTSDMRSIYENQLSTLISRKTELNKSIENTVQEIASNMINSNLSMDGAKYHIRAIFDDKAFKEKNGITVNIASIKVLYRYKNATKESGQALTIGTETYSDWNIQESICKKRVPVKHILTNYIYDYATEEGPQFNYIDIPISQGETVDVKIQVVYEPGYPFVEWRSQWSDIVNVEFPEEYTKDVTIIDIIKENNEDVKTYQFNSLLEKTGITEHCSSLIQDQSVKFFHKPEDISSGFYTEERRIIPLKDKLQELVDKITYLEDEVNNSSFQSVKITISDETGYEQNIDAFAPNVFQCQSYINSKKVSYINGNVTTETNVSRNKFMINIKNTSNHSVKLFTPQFGSATAAATDAYKMSFREVMTLTADGKLPKNTNVINQMQNNVILFMNKKINDVKNGTLIDSSKQPTTYHIWYGNEEVDYTAGETFIGLFIFADEYLLNSIKLPANNVYYKVLNAGETLNIPIYLDANLTTGSQNEQTICFAIKPAAYLDPQLYECTFKINHTNTLADDLRRTAATTNYKSTVI